MRDLLVSSISPSLACGIGQGERRQLARILPDARLRQSAGLLLQKLKLDHIDETTQPEARRSPTES